MAQGQKKVKPSAPEATTEAPTKTVEAQSPDTQAVLDKINEVQGKVKVTYGADELELDFVGKTVASVRRSLAGPFNIPQDAQAYIKGEPVAEDYILEDKSSLEFLKQSGQKGMS